jgi:Zeta toxin
VSRLDLIVGPNGAGKTTLYERVIAPGRPGLPFVNADRIAHERFRGSEVEHAYEAASIATATRTALMEARLDFCTETVFSHQSKLDLVTTAVTAGHDVVLHIVMIPFALSELRVGRGFRTVAMMSRLPNSDRDTNGCGHASPLKHQAVIAPCSTTMPLTKVPPTSLRIVSASPTTNPDGHLGLQNHSLSFEGRRRSRMELAPHSHTGAVVVRVLLPHPWLVSAYMCEPVACPIILQELGRTKPLDPRAGGKVNNTFAPNDFAMNLVRGQFIHIANGEH